MLMDQLQRENTVSYAPLHTEQTSLAKREENLVKSLYMDTHA